MEVTQKDLLLGGRELVANAWCQYEALVHLPDGKHAYCLMSALCFARDTIFDSFAVPRAYARSNVFDAAVETLRRVIGVGSNLVDWNDADDRTQADVVAAYDAAIASLG